MNAQRKTATGVGSLPGGRKARVLVVEDSRSVRRRICRELAAQAYDVREAQDGKTALGMIYEDGFDIVLLDVVMPGLDGLAVLNIIRRSYSKPELPVVMVTSRTEAGDLAYALAQGANDYVTKPIDTVVLLARIENQLMHKEAMRMLRGARAQLEWEVHKRTAQLQHQANYDQLTGLPNRNLAKDRMEQIVLRARRNDHAFSVMFLDLDGFKGINDSLGHPAGDELLVEAARRLNACVRETDTVSRLGGDEFLIILSPGHTGKMDAGVIASRILARFGDPFEVGGRHVTVTASIGVAIYPSDGEDVDTLMRNADAAMCQAKSDGRHTMQCFSAEMTVRAQRRLLLEHHLRQALPRNELSLQFQPIVCARSRGVAAAEALLRWEAPGLGSISPAEFIPVAEATGLIVPIGAWVLNEACRHLRGWRDLGWGQLRVTVNVSARQFRKDVDLFGAVAAAVRDSGIPPQTLELEITEGLLLRDDEHTAHILQDLKKMGVRISLDDFGTGYSALEYLRRYDFDVLKMDRSFVRNVLTRERDAALVAAIVAMAHRLGIRVVAEGAEEEPQFQFLHGRDCDFIQGYYFSPPLSPKLFADYLGEKDAELNPAPRHTAAGSPGLLRLGV